MEFLTTYKSENPHRYWIFFALNQEINQEVNQELNQAINQGSKKQAKASKRNQKRHREYRTTPVQWKVFTKYKHNNPTGIVDELLQARTKKEALYNNKHIYQRYSEILKQHFYEGEHKHKSCEAEKFRYI